MNTLLAKLRALFRRKSLEAEMAEEMGQHLERRIQENIADGLSPDAARYAAQRAFGGMEQTKELVREQRGFSWLEQARQDVGFAMRSMRKSPGFVTVVVFTLALGIGAITAIFSVVDCVLLRPLAYPESGRLVTLNESRPRQAPGYGVAPGNYLAWEREATDVFASVAAVSSTNYNFTGKGDPVRLIGGRASGRYFETLRTPALIGRVIGPGDDTPEKGDVVVLTHRFWQAEFGARADVLGETIRLNGIPHTIVGVMPENFQRGSPRDFFAPLALTPEEARNRTGRYLSVVARLKPGVAIEQAQARMAVIAAGLGQRHPETNKNWGATVAPIQAGVASPLVRGTLLALLGAVGALLLIACANVANLTLARAATRQQEIAVRAALGASRWRIVRQLLTESLVLALVGGALGVLFGQWMLDGLLALAPPGLPRVLEIALDARVLAVTLLLTLTTAIGFGLVPALQASRVSLIEAVKSGARGTGGGGARNVVRDGLVVAEVALAFLLLIGAGLLVRSVSRLTAFDPGFDPKGALMVNVTLPRSKYATPEKQRSFVEAVLQRYRALPGVAAVAATQVMPMANKEFVLGLEIAGREVAVGERPDTHYYAVTPDYFKTTGIRLLRGRVFTDADTSSAASVAIISQSLAERHFPGIDPLGQRVSATEGPRIWREIVGVVADVKHYGIERETDPQTYAPFAQTPFAAMTFVVRASGEPELLASSLRREIHAVDFEQPVSRIERLDNLLGIAFARHRFAMTLFTVFSGIALLLALAGTYGVMSYTVARRTREFGVRAALGARPRDLLGLVFSHAARLVLQGLALGFLSSLALGHLLEVLLFDINAHDMLTHATVVVALVSAALAAAWLPARRAARADPMVALRCE